ncbi:MAG: hypothetical protein AB7L09_03335 [Nitrospira sp.]
MRITIDDGDLRRDLDQLKETLPNAAQEAGNLQLKKLMEKLKERVIEMIPDKGGWYDLYKKSIKVNELDDDHFELTTTVTQIEYGNIDAERSLIWITGSEDATRIIAQYNPWTLDTVPAITGGLTADLLIRPASESEANTFRTKRLADLDDVEERLKAINVKMLAFDQTLPKINGRITADVPFLAKRLEYGLGGFPRTPIWTRISAEAEILSKDKAVETTGQNVYASRWWSGRHRNVGQEG